MIKNFKPQHLPFFTVCAGIIGLILQQILLRTGFDRKGLLIAGHGAGIGLYILTAIVLLVLFLVVRTLPPVPKYSQLFPASKLSFGGCILSAVGVLVFSVFRILQHQDTFAMIAAALGALAAVSVFLLSFARKAGKTPNFLLHVCLTLYLTFQLISVYRHWSSDPQLLLYIFPLLASVFLMLAAYHAACLDAQKNNRRWYVFSNQAALFFCFLSLSNDYWLFYLSMGIWAGTNLCSMYISKYRSTGSKEA